MTWKQTVQHSIVLFGLINFIYIWARLISRTSSSWEMGLAVVGVVVPAIVWTVIDDLWGKRRYY